MKMHRINIEEGNIVLLLDDKDVYMYIKQHQIKTPLINFILFTNYVTTPNVSFSLNEKKMPYAWWQPAQKEERIDNWMFEGEEQISVYLNKAKLIALQSKIGSWKKKN